MKHMLTWYAILAICVGILGMVCMNAPAQDFDVSLNMATHVCNVTLDGITYSHPMNMIGHSVLFGW
jgi:hypothetical protein